MIDSHAHIDFPDFDPIRAQVLERFQQAGGRAILNVGCDLASSVRSVELAEKYYLIYAAIGIHPHDADNLDDAALKQLEKLAMHPKVVAIGEIGMDFFREPFASPTAQRSAFTKQLELAIQQHKPIVIHCREAYTEVLEVLQHYQTDGWQGVLHCFTDTPQVAEKFLALGFHLGFTGTITYAKPHSENAQHIAETLRMLPAERILVETDCPYLAPVPHRGQMNEPAWVKNVIAKVAEMRGETPEEVEQHTAENAEKLFGMM